MNKDCLKKQWKKAPMKTMEQLIETYRQPLLGYLISLSGNIHDAEELFQDTWLRVMRHMHRFDGTNFKAWLFRIARNSFIDQTRKQQNRPFTYSEDAVELNVASHDALPDHDKEACELGERIRDCVNRLPPEQKEVFILRTEADLSFKDIANIQHCSINTALARMQYAMKKLQSDLTPEYREWIGDPS